MAVVRLQYVAGAVKVRLRYGGSMRKVRHTYGSNTVKVQSSTVKVQYCTDTFFWRLLYIYKYIVLNHISVDDIHIW